MNLFLQHSIDYANQRSYLDDLFRIYPTIPDGIRDINQTKWDNVEKAFDKKDNAALIEALLKMKLFPIKDSYVAYLRKDPTALQRNPKTINRLAGRLYELGLAKIYQNCSEPKETNRQIGPLFKRWISSGALGLQPEPLELFSNGGNHDAILDGTDDEMKEFAKSRLNYHRNKGLDFVGRFHGKYVIGEAKFITDFGGHQNAQFDDAIATLTTSNVRAISIAILDGVLYIPNKGKLYAAITGKYKNHNIMSALVLREFLYSL